MTTPFPFVAGSVLTASALNNISTLVINDKTDSYTLVIGDLGERVIMNKATATTITVPNSVFAAGDMVFIANKGAGTSTITAGAGVTINTGGSLALAQYGGGTLLALSASTFIFFPGSGGLGYGTATGGIGAPTAVTISGVNYEYLTFNATGVLTITKQGFFDYCLVGGGGGAFKVASGLSAGGGGAGQILIGSIYLSSNQTVTIGAGGSFFTYNTGAFTEGGTTSIGASSPFSVAALGNLATEKETGSAVSGIYVGGGVGSIGVPSAQTESAYIGFRSGDGASTGASGGGGSTARGGNGSSTVGGSGGAGFDVSAFIGGSALRKAMGGGGGGSGTGGTAATDGVAGVTTTTPNNGNINSGGGSGGGHGNIVNGNGGSGIAYIRYRT